MPCRDDYDAGFINSELSNENKMLKASLCAVLTAIENCGWNIFLPPNQLQLHTPMVDWKESGVTIKELKIWWEIHKELDKQRRAHEAAESEAKENKRKLAIRKEEILAKLTPEERKILGAK